MDLHERPDIVPLLELLAHDLSSTLGWDMEEARRVVDRYEHVGPEDPTPAEHLNAVVENVQYFVIEELHIMWPPCPLHGTHPIWMDLPLVWYCENGPHLIADLGTLSDMKRS